MQFVKLRSDWRREDPLSRVTGVLIKMGNVGTDTHTGRTEYEDIATSPGTSRNEETGLEHGLS